MASIQTTQNNAGVEGFLATVADEEKRRDCAALIGLMRAATKCEPKMWGPAIVGFDVFRYEYAGGRLGEICLIGFSPRKANIAVYGVNAVKYADLFAKLGKYKTAKSCVYLNRLSEVDAKTLGEIFKAAARERRAASK